MEAGAPLEGSDQLREGRPVQVEEWWHLRLHAVAAEGIEQRVVERNASRRTV